MPSGSRTWTWPSGGLPWHSTAPLTPTLLDLPCLWIPKAKIGLRLIAGSTGGGGGGGLRTVKVRPGLARAPDELVQMNAHFQPQQPSLV